MSPLVMPFLALAAFRERVTAREAIGTVVSFSGFLLLGIRDLSLDRASFTGDILCFASMLLFSLYLLLARKNETRGKLWLYIVPLYFIGGCFCLLIALAVETPLPPLRWRELPLVLGMALLPTVVGHSIYNASMKRLRSQTVTLLTQGEFLCAALLSFLFFGEVPSRVFYGAAALVIAGICVTISAAAPLNNRRLEAIPDS
jgi:drug/metabolite transporter (DMT)-like permease